MAVPTLTPSSTTSAVRLPMSGSFSKAISSGSYAFGIYASGKSGFFDANFVTGAVDQVSYTYKKLGGDILDVELTEENVYTAYEEAVLEYSYLINTHQAKNVLDSLLGATTGSFDHRGQLQDDSATGELSGSNLALRFPKFQFGYARRVGDATAPVLSLPSDKSPKSTNADFADIVV